MSFCMSMGIAKDCNDFGAGGIDTFWAAPLDAVAGVTIAAGVVTAITMEVGPPAGLFYKFEPYQETAVFTEELERAQLSSKFTQTLAAIFPIRSTAKREAIMELANCGCGLVIVHRENTGKLWIWGLTKDKEETLPIGFGAELASGTTGTSGTAISDSNNETISIQAVSTYKAYELSSAFDMSTVTA